MDYNKIKETVKEVLSEYRFYHSECVSKRCVELADRYNVDKEAARLVGIVHDIAKEMPSDEKLEYCQKHSLEVDDIECENTGLLHGKIAANIAKNEFGFSEDLCSAIEYHTTGKSNMSKLDKILYVADMTSDDRNFPDKEKLIKMADNNLDEAVIYILKVGISQRMKENKKIHLNSVKALNYFMD